MEENTYIQEEKIKGILMNKTKAKEVVITTIYDVLNLQAKSEIVLDNTLEFLGADDLDNVEIQMELEKRLEISIDDSEYDSKLTIQDIIDYVSELCSK
jgi:acyl carrier protein